MAGGHLDLRAGRTSEGVGVVGSDPELLNAFDRSRDDGARRTLAGNVVRVAFGIAGGIAAVEAEGVLVVQGARDAT